MQAAAVALFCASIAFFLYVVVGYPLALAWLARRRPAPVRTDLQFRRVTVLISVYNGEVWLRKKLESIAALDYPPELVDVLVVSDGSTDGTDAAVRAYGAPNVRLIRVPRGGKAAALNAGIAEARGDVVFFTDVRQPLDRGCLRSLLARLGDPRVAAVCGHVIFLDSQGREEAHVGLYWRYEKWIRANLSSIDSLLAGTGCIYAMRRELLVPLPPDILLDDSYQPLQAFLKGYRFVFDAGAIAYEYSTELDAEFRRKVRTLAGLYQLMGVLPGLLGPANRMWLHFVSYKLGRLLLPYALIVMAVASFGLPGVWSMAALALQAGFYLLAAVDLGMPQASRFKSITSFPRTFVVLMAASMAAVSIFFVPARSLWKQATAVRAAGAR